MAPREDLHLFSVSFGVSPENRTRLFGFADRRLDHLACDTIGTPRTDRTLILGFGDRYSTIELAEQMALLQGIEPQLTD